MGRAGCGQGPEGRVAESSFSRRSRGAPPPPGGSTERAWRQRVGEMGRDVLLGGQDWGRITPGRRQ